MRYPLEVEIPSNVANGVVLATEIIVSVALRSAVKSCGTVSGETLALSGRGTIAEALPGTVQSISLGTLSFSDATGSASNYTFSGGSFIMVLKHKLTISQRVRSILKKGRSGRNLILLPTKTTHRNVPAISERISISTPDQSITVKPCVLQNGLCS